MEALILLGVLLWGGSALDGEDVLPNAGRELLGEDCAGEVATARDALEEARRTCSVDVRENAAALIDGKAAELAERVNGAADKLGGLRELLDL